MAGDRNDDAIRELLQEERRRLEALRTGVEEENGAGSQEASLSELSSVDQHPGDIGTETFEREKQLSVLEQIDAQLSDLERAGGKLEQGTYGLCEVCGAPIGVERLEARPMARYCIEHQSQTERSAIAD